MLAVRVSRNVRKRMPNRRSQVHLHPPRAVKKIFRPNLQEKCVSASQDTKCTPPQPEQESIFRTVLLGGLDLEVYLGSL